MRLRTSKGLTRLLLALFLGSFSAHAADSLWVSDFTLTNSSPPPSWLSQLPPDPQKTFAETHFNITPPAQPADLLITVTFGEKNGGFLKVYWTTPTDSQMICENLYEGIDMPNQRSLLISQLLLKEKGMLTFQSSQADLNLYKIRWEWLEPKVIAASNEAFSLAAIDANGKALAAADLSGDPALPESDQWKGTFITAPLIDQPERIEQAIEFEAELDAQPRQARLEGDFAGLPLDKNLTVWVNGRPLAASLAVPDLTDPGYQTLPSGALSYIGWRKIQLWLPAAWLEAGVNKIQFSWGDESAEVYPVAVKNLKLQLNFTFPQENQAAETAAPVPSALP